MRKTALFMAAMMMLSLAACSQIEPSVGSRGAGNPERSQQEESIRGSAEEVTEVAEQANLPEHFVLITGGTFQMGSPEDEAWRSSDETQHTVTVSDFYMSQYEVTQAEYEAVMGENPSYFTGETLPVETVTWLDAVAYCNARSEQEGRTPVYTLDGQTVTWNRSADGYRLPTEAEWEYACRAGTEGPFYMQYSPSAENTNFYGHYPYHWWASIPMPIASFLEEYDFSGKTIVPFCSHGGGRFGQSLTAIAKLAPDAVMGEGLSVHYSGGSTLAEDVSAWLEQNHISHQ